MAAKTQDDGDDDDHGDPDDDDVAREVQYHDGVYGHMFSARLFLEDSWAVKVTLFTDTFGCVKWKAEKLSKYEPDSGLCFTKN